MGKEKCDIAMDAGEKLYKDTAAEGRELVRKELRTLREQWDTYCDQLADTLKQLEQNRAQWLSFQTDYDQLTTWLREVEAKVSAGTEMKNDLAEKKIALQNHKVLIL